MADEKYTVGDVLYVISGKTNQIVPVQVIEEVRSRTLQGERLTYIVQIGAKGSKPPMPIDQLPKPIFRSPDLIRQHMIKNATGAIETMVRKSVASATKWYGAAQAQASDDIDPDVSVETITAETDDDDDNVQRIQLPDGTMARLKSAV